jgi:hypothetical protein
MQIRTLENSDLPILAAMAEKSQFPYPDPQSPKVEAVFVVTDDDGKPIMACAALAIVELYLFCDDEFDTYEKLHALRLLHEQMGKTLIEKGWCEVNCFIPPQIALRFGRRLERTFAWLKNWPSWYRKVA